MQEKGPVPLAIKQAEVPFEKALTVSKDLEPRQGRQSVGDQHQVDRLGCRQRLERLLPSALCEQVYAFLRQDRDIPIPTVPLLGRRAEEYNQFPAAFDSQVSDPFLQYR